MNETETHKFEIHELMDLLKQSASMIWTGYGAFFTVNTLLATGYGFLLGYDSALPGQLSATLQVAISVVGIFISYCAYSVILLVRRVQVRILQRGAELDKVIGTQIFEMVLGQGQGYPWGTVIGSFLFAVIWTIGGAHAILRILDAISG
ncbi:MAG: hypothetical protein AAFN27_01175 [Pseudomonadota bacterium]